MKKIFLLGVISWLCAAAPAFAQTPTCSQRCSLPAAECQIISNLQLREELNETRFSRRGGGGNLEFQNWKDRQIGLLATPVAQEYRRLSGCQAQ